MIKKFIYIFTAISGILAGVSSCSLDIPPADQYSDPDAITNVSTARSLLTSAYLLYPHYEYELSILGDDFCQTSITGKDKHEASSVRIRGIYGQGTIQPLGDQKTDRKP